MAERTTVASVKRLMNNPGPAIGFPIVWKCGVLVEKLALVAIVLGNSSFTELRLEDTP